VPGDDKTTITKVKIIDISTGGVMHRIGIPA
jgi:hypothetical protein